MIEKYQEAASFLRERMSEEPLVGIILGSGLGNLGDKIEVKVSVAYDEIPNFPVSTVAGHKGRLLFGYFGGKPVMALQGRFHYYEGYEMDQVTFPIRVMKFLGIKYLMVSNAAGGINYDFRVGDLMIIRDHINLFPNPLRGRNYDEIGPRFPDMTRAYDPQMISKATEIAWEEGIKVHQGVYIGSSGPTFETPAEYEFFRRNGADAAGMSTVPEVIVARHAGIEVFGISVITNCAFSFSPDFVNDGDDVIEAAQKAETAMSRIFEQLISTL